MRNFFKNYGITFGFILFSACSFGDENKNSINEEHLNSFFSSPHLYQDESVSALRKFFESMDESEIDAQKVSSVFQLKYSFINSSFAAQNENVSLSSRMNDLKEALKSFKNLSNNQELENIHKTNDKSEEQSTYNLAQEAFYLTKKTKTFLDDIYSARLLITSKESLEVKAIVENIQKNLQKTSTRVLLQNAERTNGLKKTSSRLEQKNESRPINLSEYEKKMIDDFMKDDFHKLDQVKILSLKESKAKCFKAGYIIEGKSCKDLPSTFEWKKIKISCSEENPILCNPRIFGLTTENSKCKTSNSVKQKELIEENRCDFQPLCLKKDQKYTSRDCRKLSEDKPSTYWTSKFFLTNSNDAKSLKQMIRSVCYRPTKDRYHLQQLSFEETEKELRKVPGIINSSQKAKSLVDSCTEIHKQLLSLSRFHPIDKSSEQTLSPKDCDKTQCERNEEKPSKVEQTTI